jgi:hypothetical protein
VFADAKAPATRAATLLLFGDHVWVPAMDKDGGQTSFAMEHYGILLSRYRDGGIAPYFFAVEMVVTVLVCIAAGFVPKSCGVLAIAVAALTSAIFLLALVTRPYNVPLKNALVVVSDGMTAAAAVMVAVAIQQHNKQLARDGTRLALAAVNVTLASCAFSVVRFVVMHLKHCRLVEGAPNSTAVALLPLFGTEMGDVRRAAAETARAGIASTASPSVTTPALTPALAAAPRPVDPFQLSLGASDSDFDDL